MSATRHLAAFAVAFALVSASGSTALAQKNYDTGATDTEIKIGNIMPYSGAASAYGVIGKTEDAYFRKINAEGGINGRKITFISYDDAYTPPKTVIFSNSVDTGCGTATSATGPFYCPADRKVYLDLSFFDELERRFGAPGDFAQAYVIAHEIGHHVQTLLGITAEVERLRRQVGGAQANQLSVMMELQADCFAGMWAGHAASTVDPESGAPFLKPISQDQLRQAIDKIGEPHSTAVALAFFDGLTHAELAESTGVPLGTAKTRVRDGVKKLKAVLGKEGK